MSLLVSLLRLLMKPPSIDIALGIFLIVEASPSVPLGAVLAMGLSTILRVLKLFLPTAQESRYTHLCTLFDLHLRFSFWFILLILTKMLIQRKANRILGMYVNLLKKGIVGFFLYSLIHCSGLQSILFEIVPGLILIVPDINFRLQRVRLRTQLFYLPLFQSSVSF